MAKNLEIFSDYYLKMAQKSKNEFEDILRNDAENEMIKIKIVSEMSR